VKVRLDGTPSTATVSVTPPKQISSGRICCRAATLSPLLHDSTIEGLAPEKSQLQAI